MEKKGLKIFKVILIIFAVICAICITIGIIDTNSEATTLIFLGGFWMLPILAICFLAYLVLLLKEAKKNKDESSRKRIKLIITILVITSSIILVAIVAFMIWINSLGSQMLG